MDLHYVVSGLSFHHNGGVHDSGVTEANAGRYHPHIHMYRPTLTSYMEVKVFCKRVLDLMVKVHLSGAPLWFTFPALVHGEDLILPLKGSLPE